ncbi:MAG: RluA family pseudouridine synthase [Candidatus Pacebacteria bacterium]|nr:RluA family pseudouridine synthase [Candidatus Paceibacterota bacterium]MDD5445978.1 RluA family pseudouridine synthase [Candidatus Paceibacterota bacterium]
MEIIEIYQDKDVLVFEKPSGIPVLKEGNIKISFADIIVKKYDFLKEVERSGIVHRLDKDTSGVLLVGKSDKSLLFLQKQFKNRDVKKRYLALVWGNVKGEKGIIDAPLGRSLSDFRKQKAYPLSLPGKGIKREAVTKYRVIEKFKEYSFLEVEPETGRKHQIRCHLSYLGYPVAGDNLYGFKNQKNPSNLKRIFLHACYIKINLPSGVLKEFHSDLPEELKEVLENLKKDNKKHDYQN